MAQDRADFQDLRARVEAYAFDHPGDVLTFAERLRREYRWSARLAERALGEYRRFVVLAVASGHRVTPSPVVDKVWHFHLTDTRRYWEEFCPRILGRPFHHDPGRGSAAEAREHAAQYQATLRSYARLFGEAAPEDIWPRTSRPRRAPLRRAAAAVGAPWRWAPAPTRAATAGLLVALLAGCAAIFDSSSPGAIQGPEFLMWYALLILFAGGAMIWLQSVVMAPAQTPTAAPSDLGAYEIAYLARGARRVLDTGLLRLYRGGFLRLDPVAAKAELIAPLPVNALPIEAAIGEAAARGVRFRFFATQHIAAALSSLRYRLEMANLSPDAHKRSKGWIVAASLMGPVFLVGLVRLSFGQQNHRPVGFLIILMIAAAVATILMTRRSMRANSYGHAVVKAAMQSLPRNEVVGREDPQLLRWMALYGVGVLAGSGLDDFVKFAGQFSTASGGDGGGGSGGGGGCGGGCGG